MTQVKLVANVECKSKPEIHDMVDNILRHFDNIEVCTQTVSCFIRDQRMGDGDYHVRKKAFPKFTMFADVLWHYMYDIAS